jgi:hypothetical protein
MLPETLQFMQGGPILMGCELDKGICMNILVRLLMCCKVSPFAGSPLQRSSNYHYYRHITQGSPIDAYRFCSGTWILNAHLNPAEVAGRRQEPAG